MLGNFGFFSTASLAAAPHVVVSPSFCQPCPCTSLGRVLQLLATVSHPYLFTFFPDYTVGVSTRAIVASDVGLTAPMRSPPAFLKYCFSCSPEGPSNGPHEGSCGV